MRKKLIDENGHKTMHIAFGIDQNYVMPVGVSITSILSNNKNMQFVFHIVTDDLKEVDRARLNWLVEQSNAAIYVYYVNNELFKSLHMRIYWTYAAYYRLALTAMLDEKIARVLYLDGDVICNGPLDELLQIDFEGKAVVAVQDECVDPDLATRRLDMAEKKYFNSGVMYIDLQICRSEKFFEQVLVKVRDNPKPYPYVDQDPLNIVLNGKVLYIDLPYNRFQLTKFIPEDQKILIHYVGTVKPWEVCYINPDRGCFLKYYNQSLWQDVPLLVPVTYKQRKLMGKSYWRKKKYMKSFYWYSTYSLRKIRAKTIFYLKNAMNKGEEED